MVLNEAYSSVKLLLDDIHAFEYAKACNRRFGIVYELGEIVRERAETARERILRFAMLALESAVAA